MTEPTHYSLDVRRVEYLQRRSKVPDLYVKVKLGGNTEKTGRMRENASTASNATLAFSSSNEYDVFSKTVIERSERPMPNRHIGCIDISIKDLLGKCVDGETQLSLHASTNRDCTTPTCIIRLYLKDVDIERRVNIDVEDTRRYIDRIRHSANAADFTSNTIGSLVKKLDEVVKAVDEISSKVHPYLNLAWQVASVLYKVISHQFKTDKKLVDLVDMMRDAFYFARDARSLADKTKLKDAISRLLELTIEFCSFVKEYTARKFIGRTLKVISSQKIDDFNGRFDILKKALDSSIVLHNALVTGHVSSRVDDINIRQRLQSLEKLLEPNRSDTSHRARCLPKTRTEYLTKIKHWLFSPTNKNILWLNGIAGSGKSTIAASITDYCDDSSRLAAFLFFERGKNEHSSIIRSIAYQLAAFDSTLASHIIAAAEQFKNINGSLPARQFEKLLSEPLNATVDTVKGPIIIILDALDECGTIEQRRENLELFKVDFQKLPLEFRFLLTSRPENDIIQSLSSESHIFEMKLDPTLTESRDDVRAYLDYAMRKAVADPLPESWIWDEKIKLLGDAAQGLFIWASTAVKVVLNSDDPIEKLEELVSNIHTLNGLDELYTTVLKQSGMSWQEAKSVERFRKVMGLILFGKESFSEDMIDSLLGLAKGKACLTLRRLRSVLSYEPGESIHLHHASFADYLLSPERSGNHPWFIDINVQKHAIAVRCFDIMGQMLRFNICNLESSFVRNDDVQGLQSRIEENIPLHLPYTCRFWSEHLCDIPSSHDRSTLFGKLFTFIQSQVLYWFEVLSLTRTFSRVTGRALFDAHLWIAADHPIISSCLWDAYRLANIFAYPMSESAPHIYLSTLSLSKDDSVVSKFYSETHPVIAVHRLGTKPPTQCIKTFLGHANGVESVAFSPDGKHVVSGSGDHSIHIWDVESGKTVFCPFEGHTERVSSVAFSPDGKRVVSGSGDHSIRIWDVESGKTVSGPFEGHANRFSSVAFSPDGKRVVSGSSDHSIRIWDVESGKNDVSSVAFSPDGKCVVSGSGDYSIRIWDVESGKTVSGPFEGHTGDVNSVAFSPDGKRVVSGSDACSIRIWDVGSGETLSSQSDGHVRNVTLSSSDSHRTQAYPDVNKALDVPPIMPKTNGNLGWVLPGDGWVCGEDGELIIWIPDDMRRSLWSPHNTAILNCRFSTKLDLTNSSIGEDWDKRYRLSG